MREKINLEVAVPERLLISEPVDELQVPAMDGSMGILPGHAPLISRLGTGVLSCRQGSKTRYMALSGGLLEVLSDHARLLADCAEWAEEIDTERAEKSRRRARDLLQRSDGETDVERGLRAIERAQARLEASHRASLG